MRAEQESPVRLLRHIGKAEIRQLLADAKLYGQK
jgi:hypothetical protein